MKKNQNGCCLLRVFQQTDIQPHLQILVVHQRGFHEQVNPVVTGNCFISYNFILFNRQVMVDKTLLYLPCHRGDV